MSDGPREKVPAALAALVPAGAAGLLCALSGGADSAVLLVLLQEYCSAQGLPLRALHVNHGIRGAEADRDEAFCRTFCDGRGIPLTVCRVDAPAAAAAQGTGLEEAARTLRYAALEAAAGPDELIATAHNATDNAETVLFHLIRGSGSRGLSGIPPHRGRIIRPLLACGREELRAFAAAERIPYVEDSTNADLSYTRNFIRAELIPRARQINPAFEDAVLSAGAHLRGEDALLTRMAEAFLAQHAQDRSVPLAAFRSLEEPLQYRVLTLLFAELSDRTLSALHTEAVCALAARGQPGAALNLPDGVRAVIAGERLCLTRRAPAPPEEPFSFSLTEGRNMFPGKKYEIFLLCEPEFEALKKSGNVYKLFIFDKINFDRIERKLFVRNRRPGDAYRARSMTKTVRRLLAEQRVPPERRSGFPLICDGAGVLWLPGAPVADRCYPAPGDAVTYLCYCEK